MTGKRSESTQAALTAAAEFRRQQRGRGEDAASDARSDSVGVWLNYADELKRRVRLEIERGRPDERWISQQRGEIILVQELAIKRLLGAGDGTVQ